MRALGLVGGLTLMLALSGAAVAQSAYEGPLAAPSDTSAKPDAPKAGATHHKTSKKHHVAHAKAAEPQTGEGNTAGAAVPQPILHSNGEASDPVSFGMKWSGTNDTARDTRVQNYNGTAAGTGGELGMKLHF